MRNWTSSKTPAAGRIGIILPWWGLLAVSLHAAEWSQAASPGELPQSAVQRAMQADAALTSVTFVDLDRGWAVGERGVIWATDDGGHRWERQESGVACRLESVSFIDAENGWIVGSRRHLHSDRSSAVILRTRNGGRRWVELPAVALPGLKQVRFFDGRLGWAVGHGSDLFPGGVFRTDDGGRTWGPVASGAGDWLAGAFHQLELGIVAGRDGQLGHVQGPRLEPSRQPGLGPRHLRALALADPQHGWLVGDEGLVLTTGDGGRTWQVPAGPLPALAATQFDFRAVACRGPHCWVAGRPGSRILHTPDGGRSWELLTTGQPLPIHSLWFVDEQRGWAVGELGTILATRDGGRTWRRQRAGGTRAALLAVYAEPADVPWEALAEYAGEEGYLAAVELLNRNPTGPAGQPGWEDRVREAAVRLGATGVEFTAKFPVRPRNLQLSAEAIREAWRRANDGPAEPLLQAYLVARIRQWRPDVIVTSPPAARGDAPLFQLVNQAVLNAVEAAADPTAFPELSGEAGLPAWKVRKVFGTQWGDQTRRGDVDLPGTRLATRLGTTLVDLAGPSRALVAAGDQPPPHKTVFTTLINQLASETSGGGLFAGLALPPGGEARRASVATVGADLAELTRQAQKRRNVEQLLERSLDGASSGLSWLGQVDELTRGLGDAAGGDVLHQLAMRYRRAGRNELAAEVLERLIDQHPQHALTPSALLWLVQYYSSQEVAWTERRQTQFSARQVEFVPQATGQLVRQAGADPLATKETPTPLELLNGQGTAHAGLKPADRYGRALALGKIAERLDPQLHSEAAFQFALATVLKRQGLPREAQRIHERIARLPSAWAACAQSELWLAHGRGIPPRRVLDARPLATKPYLDGQLDEPAWKQATRAELRSPLRDDGDWSAVVMLAWDPQFLYLAASCQLAPGADYSAPPAESRQHDADLASHDRLELLLDLNRDHASYYRLSIDHRGQLAEACFGDASWNPQWFVACQRDSHQWTVEAAIPWSQLAAEPPQPREAWALGLQRLVPGVGAQYWTQPASPEIRPEGFGLLIFQP